MMRSALVRLSFSVMRSQRRCCSSFPPSYNDRSDFYFRAAGRVHREDRCTYQGMDIMEKLMPGVHDQKDPWVNVKNPQVIEDLYPIEADILIVGGGIMGAAAAYAFGMMRQGLNIVCLERDMSFTQASTVLSVGGIRQQFSLPENIAMSMYSAEFIRDAYRNLSVYGHEPPAINYQPQGYLYLATDAGAAQLENNYRQQRLMGAKVALYSPQRLKEEFPWLNTENIALGSYGLENEGWFDPWGLLNGLKIKARSEGARFLQGDVIGLKFKNIRQTGGFDATADCLVRRKDGFIQQILFSKLINCAGAWSGDVAKLCKIGTDDTDDPDDVRTVRLPVEPRKRYVYVVHCPNAPILDFPMCIDPAGVYVRREGLAGFYLVGCSPCGDQDEPSPDNLDVDYDYFNDHIWPILAHRIPAFENCKVKNAWAGYYDYNVVDQNAVIGGHPYYQNLYFLSGFSGHGIQVAPAAGKAIAELVLLDRYENIDLSRFDFRRFIVGAKMEEACII